MLMDELRQFDACAKTTSSLHCTHGMANENINPNLPPESSSTQAAHKSVLHHLHVDVHHDYRPIQKRSRLTRLSDEELEKRRNQGEHHLDLWTDGRLYPKNPATNGTPPFSNITSLLHFTGDGKQGLLGYVQQLEARALSLDRVIEPMSKAIKDLHEQNQCYMKKLNSYEKTVKDMENQIHKMREKDTLLGVRRRCRKLTNIHQMKLGCGGVKKRIQAVRSLLHPDGGADCITEAGRHYSPLIPKQIMDELLALRKFKSVHEKHAYGVLDTHKLDASEVQAIMDDSGISCRGYKSLYKALSQKGEATSRKLSILPKPTWVNCRRHQVNSEVLSKLGTPFHIEGKFVGKDREVVFNEKNNIFFDLESLQRYAVDFFRVTTTECGAMLKFVLKLDECEIVKGKKVERVTITLMNRVLDPSISKEDRRYFSVQSENNILPLGSFEVHCTH